MSGTSRSFGQAVRICFEKYVVFSGRAPRAEYWYWTLFSIVLDIGIQLAAFVLSGGHGNGLSGGIGSLVTLALFLPGLAVQIRRLHDLSKSGWLMLIVFIPLIGWIIMLVWMCTCGTPGPNRFGNDPLTD